MDQFLWSSSIETSKDTVFVAHAVLGRPRHVEQDEFGLLGLLYDDLIEPQCCMHAPHINLASDVGDAHSYNELQRCLFQKAFFVSFFLSYLCSHWRKVKMLVLTSSPIPCIRSMSRGTQVW